VFVFTHKGVYLVVKSILQKEPITTQKNYLYYNTKKLFVHTKRPVTVKIKILNRKSAIDTMTFLSWQKSFLVKT
jgi:hypothetical protein